MRISFGLIANGFICALELLEDSSLSREDVLGRDPTLLAELLIDLAIEDDDLSFVAATIGMAAVMDLGCDPGIGFSDETQFCGRNCLIFNRRTKLAEILR